MSFLFWSKNKYSMKGELPKSLIVHTYIRFQIFFQIFRFFYSYALFAKYKDQLKKYIKDQLNKLNHHFGQTTITTTCYFILTSFLSLLINVTKHTSVQPGLGPPTAGFPRKFIAANRWLRSKVNNYYYFVL